jgi:hypothetical protein
MEIIREVLVALFAGTIALAAMPLNEKKQLDVSTLEDTDSIIRRVRIADLEVRKQTEVADIQDVASHSVRPTLVAGVGTWNPVPSRVTLTEPLRARLFLLSTPLKRADVDKILDRLPTLMPTVIDILTVPILPYELLHRALDCDIHPVLSEADWLCLIENEAIIFPTLVPCKVKTDDPETAQFLWR